jgi:hypothetical protein
MQALKFGMNMAAAAITIFVRLLETKFGDRKLGPSFGARLNRD